MINGFVDVVSHKFLFVGVERIAKGFTGTLAIALGLGSGITIVRLFKKDEAEGV